jgi:hypothetical protein
LCKLTPEGKTPPHLARALGRWIRGGPWSNQLSECPSDMLLKWVRTEGVQGLVQARAVAQATELPGALRNAMSEAARAATLTSMLLEAETRRVLAAMRQISIPGLLLKGSALAYWAYPQPQMRNCSDVDILLPARSAAEQLAGVLGHMGYFRSDPSGELVAYELMCTKPVTPGWSVEVDVHWRLANSALFADRFGFDELMEASVAIPSLGTNGRGLGPVHALLHAAMHRSCNLSIGLDDRLKWLYDFVVLTDRLTDAEWRMTVELARNRQIAGVTLSALDAANDAFDLALPQHVLDALRQAARHETLDATRLTDWRYMQAQTLRSLPGLAARMGWLWQRLFPSGDYMRYLYGERTSGYAGLLRVRAQRAWRKWHGQA